MRFGVLGPLEARLADGTLVPIGAPRLRALLAMLVLDAGRIVGQDRLIDGLYGTDLPANAANALQSQVSRLRRLLPGAVIEHSPAGYRLLTDPSSVDASLCAELVAQGRGAEALALWRGPALADVDTPFAAAARARLEELHIDAVAVEGDVAALRDLVTAHPLRENLRAALMHALHRDGRQAEALEVFESGRRLLAEELGVDPSPDLAAAHLEVLRAERPRRLPAQLTSFVGRTDEVRRVTKWLGEARLVTLTGPGGAGKTRLAVETAGQWPDEVYFADLGAVNGPFTRPVVAPEATSDVPQRGSAGGGAGAEVAQAVLTAVGARETGLRSPAGQVDAVDRLAAALADRPVLLVVDNCEHVIADAATVVGKLLAGCPNLRVLATSREPLAITGETLCPLPPLEATSAARLFIDRALAVRPDLEPDARVVATICAALDGMPLAIELAAARARALPLTEIATRLDDRFRLLTRGSRTAAPRHRTLQAVVEWSWDLLDDAERDLATQLTVFTGGASLDAIRAVCGLADVDVLTGLVDKSLVEISDDRYRMLDTIRAFCAAKAREDIRPRHAAHFLALAREAEPHLRRTEQLTWLHRLARDNDNLTAAVRWAIAADHRTALELIAALTTYWWFRGLRTDAARLADDLLVATGDTPVPGMSEEYAMALLIAWPVATGDQTARMRLTTRLTDALDAPPRYPIMTMIWGMATGAPTGVGLDHMERRYGLLGADPWSLALARLGEGLMALQQQDITAAERLLADGVVQFQAVGDRWGTSLGLAQLAEIALLTGHPERAVERADQARHLIEELDAAEDLADLLCVRATALATLGDLAGAEADYRRSIGLARQAGSSASLANCHLGMGELALRRGHLDEATELCDQAWDECPSGWYGPEQTRCYIQFTRGRIAAARGDHDGARAAFTDAVRRARAQRDQIAIKTVSGEAGVVDLDVTDDETAERVHQVAQRAYRVEAGLIGADSIPPLHETLDEMRAQPLTWLGVPGDDGLPVAFVAYEDAQELDINRLCVDPGHFRKGLARRLVRALPPRAAVVHTGALNTPATTLYAREGFERTGTIEPEPGLLVATFRRPAPATTATPAASDAG
ncbi:GNAT family N-acetyltransferase [Lentzea tibetensis]|uniref:GNAT family N-acetyltransferase n=1 Tax=Lentzea tibetensis TaxID=2591470 RepID=A0A563EQB3_9PSEU|nr:GNAT family N-acetyltransferase [Lentzea tibetensis]TWP49586.1 GNAT family N-acetyltransferase [Lentzea tibetensis]